jgi:hypothetical protein
MGLRIELGQTVHVERRITGSKSLKGVSKLLGAKPPRYLILEIPTYQGQLLFSTVNEECVVRFLKDGTLVGFWSRVVKIVSEPFPLMIVEYPTEVEELTVREHERVDCNIPSVLILHAPIVKDITEEPKAPRDPDAKEPEAPAPETPRSSPPMKASMVDMSKGGCLIAVRIPDWRATVRKMFAMDPASLGFYEAEGSIDRYIRGSYVDVQFELPSPARPGARQVRGEVRWSKREGSTIFLGTQFHDCPADIAADIEAIISQQREFFTRRADMF